MVTQRGKINQGGSLRHRWIRDVGLIELCACTARGTLQRNTVPPSKVTARLPHQAAPHISQVAAAPSR